MEAQALGAELLLYDVTRERALCLQPAAALVWQEADGARTVAELGALLTARLGVAEGEAWVRRALEELEAAGLLEEGGEPPARTFSRRTVLRRLGMAASAPLVLAVLAPTPAMAGSKADGEECNSDEECASGLCAGDNKNFPGVCTH